MDLATVAPGEPIAVTLGVGGVTWPIWAGALGRALERQLGARNFGLDIDNGVATFLPQAGEPLDLAAVERAVHQAGFEPLWLELELQGKLSHALDAEGNECPSLTVASTGQRFLLYAGESEEERSGYSRLIEWLETGERDVVVRGRAHPHSTGLSAVTIQGFRVLDGPSS